MTCEQTDGRLNPMPQSTRSFIKRVGTLTSSNYRECFSIFFNLWIGCNPIENKKAEIMSRTMYMGSAIFVLRQMPTAVFIQPVGLFLTAEFLSIIAYSCCWDAMALYSLVICTQWTKRSKFNIDESALLGNQVCNGTRMDNAVLPYPRVYKCSQCDTPWGGRVGFTW